MTIKDPQSNRVDGLRSRAFLRLVYCASRACADHLRSIGNVRLSSGLLLGEVQPEKGIRATRLWSRLNVFRRTSS